MRGGSLAVIDILDRHCDVRHRRVPAARAVVDQLDHYFSDPSFRFSLSLDLRGTAFQQRVWRALADLQPGSVVSYGALAARLATAARPLGGACRANPVPIVIPCHRVISAAGPGGYMGHSRRHLSTKLWLLRHEGVGFD